jgi:hypothetical protein
MAYLSASFHPADVALASDAASSALAAIGGVSDAASKANAAALTASDAASKAQVKANTASSAAALKAPLIGPVINSQADSYTLVLTDAGKTVVMTKGSANNLTVPPYSSVAFAVNTRVDVLQNGAGKVTIVAGSGVTINSKGAVLSIGAQYVGVTLINTAQDAWTLVGDIIA